MARKDPRIEAYIAKAEPFAQPILKHLRKIVHTGCPAAEETIKWSMPHFNYKGPFCGMAAFKQHCSFGFWKSTLIFGEAAEKDQKDGMGHFGRITSLKDLPNKKKLLGYVRKAVALNDAGTKEAWRMKPRSKAVVVDVPAYFADALKRNKKAGANFKIFSQSKRNEYVEWLTDAKRDDTREKRLATALEWIAEGKTRNWKYEPK
jgi:uncharacterized protein YdeI (YjbR/CyaY-like superfamily)